MSEPLILAIDLGTTNCKAVLLDDSGMVVGRAAREHPLLIPQNGWAEQVPERWWEVVTECIHEMRARCDLGSIRAIGLSGQMHGLVLLDGRAEVLRPAILWNDQRSATHCEEIYVAAGGMHGLLGFTNNSMLPGYTGGKILWVRDHEPEVFQRISRILLPKDYIRYRMCGEIATDFSDASGTGLFDVREKRWSGELLARLKLPPEWFPRAFSALEIVGELTTAAASVLGLPKGLPVIAGGGDAVVHTVGSRAINPGTALVVIGTGGNVTVTVPHVGRNPDGALQSFCHVLPGMWVSYGAPLCAGNSLKWFRGILGGRENQLAADPGTSAYELLTLQAASSPPGAGGVLFLPYLQGERCPVPDVQLRGAFIGIGLDTEKEDLIRSILEGVAFSLRDVLELILQSGVRPQSVVASGGGAASPLWRQILADVFNREVTTLENSEIAGAIGAGILAGVAVGLWPSAFHASERIRSNTINTPHKSHVSLYEQLYKIFRQQRIVLKPTFDNLSLFR
jgi:xylulokinase